MYSVVKAVMMVGWQLSKSGFFLQAGDRLLDTDHSMPALLFRIYRY